MLPRLMRLPNQGKQRRVLGSRGSSALPPHPRGRLEIQRPEQVLRRILRYRRPARRADQP